MRRLTREHGDTLVRLPVDGYREQPECVRCNRDLSV